MVNINEEFLYAVRGKDLESTKAFLKRGANINYRDKFGSTGVFYAVTSSNFEMLNFLISNRPEINFLYDNDENLLHIAVIYYARFHPFLDIVELLIEDGVEINRQNKFGNTPLSNACTQWAASKALIDVLIKHGADMDIKNNYGLSPYTMSFENDLPELKLLLDSLRQTYSKR